MEVTRQYNYFNQLLNGSLEIHYNYIFGAIAGSNKTIQRD